MIDSGMNDLPTEERIAQLEFKLQRLNLSEATVVNSKVGAGAISDAGTTVITTGFQAKKILLIAVMETLDGGESYGVSDFTSHNCVYRVWDGSNWTQFTTAKLANVEKSGGGNYLHAVATADATSVTITWTKIDSPGTVNFIYDIS